jgi:hypothetical protein
MMVEDGRRLLISNLDLGFISRNHAPMIRPQYPAQSRQDLEGRRGSGGPPGLDSETGLASFSAVEFFRLFPAADTFQVSTAARMSATFPYVSPTVYLPTRPPRRVVDAGYYDNYGVNVAAMWALEFRDWLMKNTSGVALIEIRDHDGQRQRVELGDEPRPVSRNPLRALALGATSLISPVSGLFSARSASMMYRNDEQLEWLGSYLPRGIDDRNGGQPLFLARPDYDPAAKKAGDFFVSLAVEAPRGVSLSWTLTAIERSMLRHAIGDAVPTSAAIPDAGLLDEVRKVRESNRARLDQLVKWWLEPR